MEIARQDPRKDHVCQLTDRDIGAIKGFDFL